MNEWMVGPQGRAWLCRNFITIWWGCEERLRLTQVKATQTEDRIIR